MRITRFFTGSDNETHFEELEIPLQGGTIEMTLEGLRSE